MSWSVTLNGRTYTEANVEGTAYADEANGLPAMFQDFATDAGFAKGVGATSATNLTPATGTLVFTTDQDASAVAIPDGALVKATSAADTAKYAIGTVTSFTGTTLTVNATIAAGAAAADWVITHAVTAQLSALFKNLDAGGFNVTNAGTIDAQVLTAAAQTVSGLSKFHAGSAHAELALGTLTTTPAVITAATESFVSATLAADITQAVAGGPLILSGGGYRQSGYGKVLAVTQDGTGARDLIVRRANHFQYSEDLLSAPDNIDSGAQRTNVTVAADAQAAPFGATTMVKVSSNVTSGTHGLVMRRGTNSAANSYRAWASGFFKASAGSGYVRLQLQADSVGHGAYVDVDLATGANLGTGVIGSGSIVGAPVVTDLGGGIYQIGLLVDQTSAALWESNLSVLLLDAARNATHAESTHAILVWGLQLYQSAAALDYIAGSTTPNAVWAGTAPVFTGQAAGVKTRFSITVAPDGDLEASKISEV
ncbi:MAG: hypothetical protein HQ481_13870 [Alphaproteobacteria bacterium]|nr:hypothetical protein [Alphaproteobacteria bacterium]